MGPLEKQIIAEVRPYTMTSPERLLATMDAVRYVLTRGVPGALVECGVWRGGSVLTMIRTLQAAGVTDRDIYLYDTFTGMTTPTDLDTSAFEPPAVETWNETPAGRVAWEPVFGPAAFGLEQVRALLAGSGYPDERIHVVVGPVETTIPSHVPAGIAVLRLDTDWYESTAHELRHLYPLLDDGGVLILDDYGHWDGARRAVDEYFASEAPPLLLARTDYTGRIAIKH